VAEIQDPAVLKFTVADAKPIIQEVFANDMARTLWLGIKGTHLVDQHFNQACLELARVIEQRQEPITAGWLTRELQHWNMIGSAETFGDILLPYVTGEKAITWVEVGRGGCDL